jgi:hypothetical protein
MLTCDSAFWGTSFVDEMKRISAHGEKKLKLRRASIARNPATDSQPLKIDSMNGSSTTEEKKGERQSQAASSSA